MISSEFVWKHGGGHVLLAGSFSQWQGVPMSYNGQSWQERVDLAPGQYHYKFIVDGNWKYDHQMPIAADSHGNINNLIIVGEGQQVPSKGSNVSSAPIKAHQAVSTATKVEKKPEENKKIGEGQQQGKAHPLKKEEKKPENKGKPEEKKKEDNKGKPQDNKGKPEDKKKEDNKGKPQDNKGKPQDNKGKPEDKKKEDNKGKPQDKKDQSKKKEEEHHPGRLVGHWEKVHVNSITGKESWWVFVKSEDDPAKFPLRRRIPPDCVHCGSTVLVEDEVFARYGVEWQPLCIKCYANGHNIPLINGKNKPTSKPVCHWCLETEDVTNDICHHCKDYVTRQQANFGQTKNDALTTLYYYQTALRNSRRPLLNH